MNATNRDQAIQRFLTLCGEPREPMFLKWFGRETFFEREVQKVLLDRHPSRFSYSSPFAWSYPIDAWATAEQQSLGTREHDATELDALAISRNDREWFARLTIAVSHARKAIHDRERKPQSTLEKFIAWRNRRFLWETDSTSPMPPPGKYAEAVPDSIVGDAASRMDGAIRKAVHDENKRRDGIMATWATSWLTHLLRAEPPQSATDLARKILAESRVTESPPNQ